MVMRNKLGAILLLTALLSFSGVCAQATLQSAGGAAKTNIPVQKRLELPDPVSGGTVVLNNHVNLPLSADADREVTAYRIRLFSSNAQNARAEAAAVEQSFAGSYPGIPLTSKYDAPYFMVLAGIFLTHEEAAMLLSRIAAQYPTAFIVSERHPISVFGGGEFTAAEAVYGKGSGVGGATAEEQSEGSLEIE